MTGRIQVHGLGKVYKRYPSRWSRLREWLTLGSQLRHERHWALRDVSFEVASGEAVGIIGLNGAGKSTLLKLVTGTTTPTTGSVAIEGRVAALLELGMGFHPDFTGRQNVMIAGQLLGLTASRLKFLLPEIEGFAELGGYMDQPVRVYSSGMQVRLAFALATAERPDVLIVDEALSVGDAYFQHKCLARIRTYREAGTTLLLVSHDKQAIKSMCSRAILLHRGRIESEGCPESVLDFYNALLADFEKQNVKQISLEDGRTLTISGTGEASIRRVELRDDQGRQTSVVAVGSAVSLVIEVIVNQPIERLVLGYGIRDKYGQVVYGTNTALTGQTLSSLRPGQEVRFEVAFATNLGPGSYSVQLALVSAETHLDRNYEWRDMALVFSVVNLAHVGFEGCAWLPPTIRISL